MPGSDRYLSISGCVVAAVWLGENHVEVVGRSGNQGVEAGQCAPAEAELGAHQTQSDIGRDQAAHHQHHHLHHVGVAHHLHPANGNEQRKQRQQDDDDVKRVAPHQITEGQRPKVENRSQVDQHVEKEPEDAHNQAQRGVVALLQKLRHRKNLLLQEYRHEEHGHDDEHNGRHPFIGCHRHAHLKAGARHANKLLGRDVGGNHAGPDGPPRQGAFGQKVVFGALLGLFLAPVDVVAVSRNADQVNQENQDVERGEVIAHSRGWAGSPHPLAPSPWGEGGLFSSF